MLPIIIFSGTKDGVKVVTVIATGTETAIVRDRIDKEVAVVTVKDRDPDRQSTGTKTDQKMKSMYLYM